MLEVDSAQIEAAIWVDGAGRASPTESSKDHWLARSLNVGCLVRVDRQPDDRWERHPSGDEVIHLVSGSLRGIHRLRRFARDKSNLPLARRR